MSNLLFEIYSEEIPSQFQYYGSNRIYSMIRKKLEHFLKIKIDGTYFFTSKRIGFNIYNIPKNLPGSSIEIRGPKIDSTQKSLEGFLRKYRLKSVVDLVKKDKYYFYTQKSQNQSFEEAIKLIIEEVMITFTWPQSMKWGKYNIKWIRPIYSILCLFDNKVLKVSYGHIVANNKIYYKDKSCNIDSFEEYKEILQKSYIYIFQEHRLDIIKDQIKNNCHVYNIKMIEDVTLLKEVANLVESPYVAIGRIEKHYMQLPREILITTLKFHQKYFPTEYSNGCLAPYFIVISNSMTNDNLKTVVNGNEKVLRSRLADIQYFYHQDLKTTLRNKVEKLKTLIFHHLIGSYYDVVQNINATALNIAHKLQVINKLKIELISKLIKSDLVTEVVRELPMLQGTAGYYFALHDDEEIDVSHAIKEHYLPQGPKDQVPDKIYSIIFALADKIVLLNLMFRINVRATGSKDPYALRRAAIGIIRIICSNKLDISLVDLLNKDVIYFIQERIFALSNSVHNIYHIDLKYIKSAITI